VVRKGRAGALSEKGTDTPRMPGTSE
jgi:hypothetical protein